MILLRRCMAILARTLARCTRSTSTTVSKSAASCFSGRRNAHPDTSALGKLDGIADQVLQNLTHAPFIAQDAPRNRWCNVEHDIDALAGRRAREQIDVATFAPPPLLGGRRSSSRGCLLAGLLRWLFDLPDSLYLSDDSDHACSAGSRF